MAFEAGSVVARLRLITTDFSKGIKDAQSQTEGLRAGLEQVAGAFGRVAAVSGVALAALTGGLALATRKGAQFDDSLTNVGAILRSNNKELAELENIAIQAGEATVFSATQAADAMFNLASQGINTTESFEDLLGPILNAAAALRRGVQPVAALTLATIKSFGLENDEAARVVNIFSAANEASTLNLERLEAGLKTIGPTAASFGVEIETTVALLGTLTDRGLQAEEAGTALRNIFLSLNKTTPKARKLLEKVGFTQERIAKLLPTPIKLFKELGKTQLSNAQINEIFGKRAFASATILLKSADAAAALTDKISGTQSATEIAELQLRSFGNQMKLMSSAIESAAIALFRSLEPALRDIVASARAAFLAVADFVKQNPALVAGVTKATLVILAIVTALSTLIAIAASAGIAILGVKVAMAGLGGSAAAATVKVIALKGSMLLLKVGALGVALAIGIGIGTAINKLIENVFPKLDKALDDLIAKMFGFEKSMRGARVETGTKLSSALRKAARDMEALSSVRVIPGRVKVIIEKTGIAFENLSPPIKRAIENGRNFGVVIAALIAEADKLDKALKIIAEAPQPIEGMVEGRAEPPVGGVEPTGAEAAEVAGGGEAIFMGLTPERIEELRNSMMAFQTVLDGIQGLVGGIEQGFVSFFQSIFDGSKSAADALKGLGKAILASIVRTFAIVLGKIVAISVIMFVVKSIFGQAGLNIVAAALGVGTKSSPGGGGGGGKVKGAQFGLLPPGEDILVGIRREEGVLTGRGVEAVGGAAGLADLNAGGGVGGTTTITNILQAPLVATAEAVEAFRELGSEARREFAGGT